MLKFGFLEKGLGIVLNSMIFQGKCFSSYFLLPGQIALPECLYFLKYWIICVFQLFVKQLLTSSVFPHDQKVRTKI